MNYRNFVITFLRSLMDLYLMMLQNSRNIIISYLVFEIVVNFFFFLI
jgi:hypothetical protein